LFSGVLNATNFTVGRSKSVTLSLFSDSTSQSDLTKCYFRLLNASHVHVSLETEVDVAYSIICKKHGRHWVRH